MKTWKFLIPIAAICIISGCAGSGSTADIPAVSPFSVERYLGTWYEAARMPQWFEDRLDRVTAEYSSAGNGTVRVCNRGFRDGKLHVATGIARQKRKDTGELEVSFFRPFYGDYRVVALKNDYSAALVISSSKNCAWILVRDPAQAQNVIPEYVALLKKWGFDCTKLEYPRMKDSSF